VLDVGMIVASDALLADPETLGMQPHPEGGWYRETWRHEIVTPTQRGDRPLATCVSFLLLPGERSAWHRVTSAELWLWQGGGPVRLTVGGTGAQPEPGRSQELSVGGQYLVAADEWQTAEPVGERAVLVACVVSPGFVFEDFTLAGPVGGGS
jgi:predicted cupin superfamily sugar epimerase